MGIASKFTLVREVLDWFHKRVDIDAGRRTVNAAAERERLRVLRLFGDRFGENALRDLSDDDLASFVHETGQKAAWTIKRWVATIRKPFNVAERSGRIEFNPFKRLNVKPGKRGRDATKGELRLILQNCPAVYRRVVVFLRLTGMRPGELRKLTWDMIRPDLGAIVIRVHKTSDRQIVEKPRRIPITPIVAKMLCWLRKRSSGAGVIFRNSFGRPWSCKALTKRLGDIRERLGLADDLKLYGCRHAFATAAVIAGVDIMTLAELMGHSTTKTTEWYVHIAGKSEFLLKSASTATAGAFR